MYSFSISEVISLVVVVISGIPYIYRTWTADIKPRLSSWTLWTGISIIIFVTAVTTSVTIGILAMAASVLNCVSITLILIFKQKLKYTEMDGFAKYSFRIGLMAIIVWILALFDFIWSGYALYLSLIADAISASDTIQYTWRHPEDERPFAWIVFSIGYLTTLFGLESFVFVNIITSVYMFIGSFIIAFPLIIYRIKGRVPLIMWV